MKTTTKINSSKSSKETKKEEYKTISECLQVTEKYIEEYYSYSRNSKSSGLSKLLNDRTEHLKNQEITTRQVNSWDDYGLLDIGRVGKEWRKYSIMDAVWLNVISELRNFGIPVEVIRNVKSALELGNDIVGTPMPLLEFCIYKALRDEERMVLLVFMDGSAFPLSYDQYLINALNAELNNFLLIDLNEILKRNFENNKKVVTNKIEASAVSDEEMKLLNFIRNGRYEKVSVMINNRKLDILEGVERVNIKKSLFDVKNEYQFQDVTFKQQAGDTVNIKRTIRKKINEL